jgi:arylsulfatase A-like enzyme
MRDPSRVVVALTADHGFGTIPELAQNVTPAPTRVTLRPALVAARQRMQALGMDTLGIDLDFQVLLIDRAAFTKAKVNPDTVLRVFREEALRTPGVYRVDRWTDLVKGDTVGDPITRRWTHQFPAEAQIEYIVTLTKGSLWQGPLIASHGTPYDYDSNVPIIFYGPEFKPGRYPEFVRTVDIAPTLAAAAGVKPGEKLDGVVLTKALK